MLLQCPHECTRWHMPVLGQACTHALGLTDGCRQGAARPHDELIAAAFGSHEAVVLLLLERKENAPWADCKDGEAFLHLQNQNQRRHGIRSAPTILINHSCFTLFTLPVAGSMLLVSSTSHPHGPR